MRVASVGMNLFCGARDIDDGPGVHGLTTVQQGVKIERVCKDRSQGSLDGWFA